MVDDERTTARRPRTKDMPEVMAVMQRIAGRVTALREERGYSMRELSRRCDFNIHMIQRIEAAKGDVQLGSLLILAKQLDVSVVDLIAE